MKKKRIKIVVMLVIIIILISSVSVFADGAKSWSQNADNSKANITYFGRVEWLDKGYAPNVIIYYAKLGGKDADLITTDNAAKLRIKSGVLYNDIVSEAIYFNRYISTRKRVTTATSIRVYWSFDGFSDNFSLK